MRSLLKKAVLLAAFVGCVGGAGSRAFAQETLIADVPFAFVVSGTTHDAGRYEFDVTDGSQAVELRGPARAGGLVPVMSRLAEPETRMPDGRLVFDKVGDTYYLSELWIPGVDGFLLYAATEKHTHHAVTLHRFPRES